MARATSFTHFLLPAAVALCIAAVAGCGADPPARESSTPAPEASGAARTGEAGPTTTMAPSDPPSGPRVAGLERTLNEELQWSARSATASAAAAAVIVRGRMLRFAFGAASSADALFSLASLTKPFIALLTLRLVEDRRLSLTDTVGRWLGHEVARSVRSTTIRQLLGHTSDVADYILDPDIQAALRDPRHPWTEKELLRTMRSAGFRGGTFNYSNSNYVLLGAILRRATGGSVDALLDKEILSRLRLRRASLRRRGALARDVAGGGRLGTGVWGELFTDGGMISSARDVALFLDALLVQRRLLEPQTLRRMLTPGPDGRYGLGLEQSFLGGSCEFWGHGGFWDGWATAGATELTSGSTIVVLLRDAAPGDAYTTASLLAGALGRHGALPCF